MSTTTRVSDATARIIERRRKNRWRPWLRIGLGLLVLALLGGAAWLVLVSDVLGVRQVAVTGNHIVNTDDVRRLAEVPVGTPLARADLTGVATRVSGLPAVRSVSVTRAWPNTLDIAITERAPMFAIETPGGYWIADDQGVIFQSVSNAPSGLMVAAVPTNDPRLLRDLGTVLSALPGELRSRVRQVSAETPDSITLLLNGGDTVVWGSADQSELKAQVIVPLLKQPGTRYDVSAPSFPTVR